MFEGLDFPQSAVLTFGLTTDFERKNPAARRLQVFVTLSFLFLLIEDKRTMNMKANEIEARVKKIVVEQLGVKEEEITIDASFVDDLGADSLDTVELVMALEEEFETEIPDDDAEKIVTIKDAVKYIVERMDKETKAS